MPGVKKRRGGQTGSAGPAVNLSDFQAADLDRIKEIAKIVAGIKNDPNQQPDTNGVQQFFNAIGWTSNKPELVESAQDLANMKDAKSEFLFHTDMPWGSVKDAKTFADQYMGDGRQFMSNGVYGGGTYFASTEHDSWEYGAQERKAYQFMARLNSKAKVIDSDLLRKEISNLSMTKPKVWQAIKDMNDNSAHRVHDTQSLFAAYFGYNVIYAKADGYYTVLDRAATTVSREGVHYDGTFGKYKN